MACLSVSSKNRQIFLPFLLWACFQDQTVWWLYQQGHGMSRNWSRISWWPVMGLSTSAHREPAPLVLWRLPTPILAGSVSVDWMWFSCSDYFVSHYSNILWLITFGCAFPSSLFLLKAHCVCKSLSGSGLWQLGFSEVAQITLWGGAVLSLFPCSWESLPRGLLSPHSPLQEAWLVSLSSAFAVFPVLLLQVHGVTFKSNSLLLP